LDEIYKKILHKFVHSFIWCCASFILGQAHVIFTTIKSSTLGLRIWGEKPC
jgi:hypothetical protein